MSKTELFLVVVWSCAHFQDTEINSRSTPPCKELDLGALSETPLWKYKEEEQVVVEINMSSRDNLTDWFMQL